MNGHRLASEFRTYLFSNALFVWTIANHYVTRFLAVTLQDALETRFPSNFCTTINIFNRERTAKTVNKHFRQSCDELVCCDQDIFAILSEAKEEL